MCLSAFNQLHFYKLVLWRAWISAADLVISAAQTESVQLCLMFWEMTDFRVHNKCSVFYPARKFVHWLHRIFVHKVYINSELNDIKKLFKWILSIIFFTFYLMLNVGWYLLSWPAAQRQIATLKPFPQNHGYRALWKTKPIRNKSFLCCAFAFSKDCSFLCFINVYSDEWIITSFSPSCWLPL